MTDVKNVILYSAVGLTVILVISGITIRRWLKVRVEAAGSPAAFAAQTALSGLEHKIQGELSKTLTQAEKEHLQQAIQHIRVQSPRFDQTQTIRLFEILGDFNTRTKNEHGKPSQESIFMFVSNLETLSPSKVPQAPRNQ
jgi:hypothetical protein